MTRFSHHALMPVNTRRILVSCALPYANGPIHIGHMVEHVQGDIWVRAMRMAGHEVHFVCADDAHGTPIMLRAERENITPEALIAASHEQHVADFRDFGIAYDHYSSTHSDTNRDLTTDIHAALKRAGHVDTAQVEQFYDPERDMFLPDRFIKGTCPHCHAADQYGDACEVCGKTYEPTDLIEPWSVISGAVPVRRESEHHFVRLADFQDMLESWLAERRDAGGLQPEVVNKLREWFDDGLRSWDISRDAPYFGFHIPGTEDKYFYVWVDAPVGYLATFRELAQRDNLDADAFIEADAAAAAGTEMVHFIGKDITYFHALFWPAMLHGAGLRTPTAINVHGFLTVDGAKMSKSRGTFINARTWLQHLDAEYLRYYLATLLDPSLSDLDLDMQQFQERVNSHLVGKWVNIASRTAGFLRKRFDNRLATALDDAGQQRYTDAVSTLSEVPALYEARDYAAAMRRIMAVADDTNAWIAERAPWQMAKEDGRDAELHQVCTLAINLFRALTIHLKPVLPQAVARAEAFLQSESAHFSDAATPLLNHSVARFKPLLTRIDPKDVTAMTDASREDLQSADNTADQAPEPDAISIDDFARVDLRVGRVTSCENVDGSNKLLRFELDAGELGTRQIFSGIQAAYPEPEALHGRHVVFVNNLPPRKMRFGVSEGMILSAGEAADTLKVVEVDTAVPPGSAIA